MKRIVFVFALALPVLSLPCSEAAEAKAPKKTDAEADYYRILTFTPPPEAVLECGALELMPDGKIAIGTRRGEVWFIDNAYDADPKKVKFTRFAYGLHEILGLAAKDDWLYVV